MTKMDVELALKINKLVHNECTDVPHDIGLRIEELVRLHQIKYKKKENMVQGKMRKGFTKMDNESNNNLGVLQWVSVDERLPNEHQDVLVYYYGNRNSKHFPDLQFVKQSSFYNNRFECDEEVTHWAELPELPPQKS